MKNENEDAKIRFDATTGMIRALSLGIGLYHEVGACAARGRGTQGVLLVILRITKKRKEERSGKSGKKG